jgi:hypothetical protein
MFLIFAQNREIHARQEDLGQENEADRPIVTIQYRSYHPRDINC